MCMEMNLSQDKPTYPEPPFEVFEEEILSKNTKDNAQEQEKEEDLPFEYFNEGRSEENLMEAGAIQLPRIVQSEDSGLK